MLQLNKIDDLVFLKLKKIKRRIYLILLIRPLIFLILFTLIFSYKDGMFKISNVSIYVLLIGFTITIIVHIFNALHLLRIYQKIIVGMNISDNILILELIEGEVVNIPFNEIKIESKKFDLILSELYDCFLISYEKNKYLILYNFFDKKLIVKFPQLGKSVER